MNFDTMPNVIAIVGSRNFPESKKEWIRGFIQKLPNTTIIVSGGARGVDSWAKQYTQESDLHHYKEFAVENFEWNIFGKSAGHLRNAQIVQYVKTHGGLIVVFYTNENGVMTRGSTNVVTTCLKEKVPTILISETGEIKGTHKH